MPVNANCHAAATQLRSLDPSRHLASLTSPKRLFRRLRNEIREAVFERLAVLIRSVFRKTVAQCISTLSREKILRGDCWRPYAGARVVFRKVDLQISHWMSLACSLTFSCDLATPFSSLSLRARFEAAFAPWCWCWCQCQPRVNGGRGAKRETNVAATHIC